MADVLDIVGIVASNLQIPTDMLTGPMVIFNVVIPAIALFIMWFDLLHYKVRILHTSLVNFILAIVLAIVSLPLVIIFSPTLITAVGFAGAYLFHGYFSVWRMVITAGIFAAVFFLLPWGMSYFSSVMI